MSVVSCPAAPGLWWTSSQACPSPRLRSQCMKLSAPIPPATRRRKVLTSQSVSRSSLSSPPSKVSAVLRVAPNPSPWPQDLPALTSRLSTLPRAPGCQRHLHSTAGRPSDPKPGVVPRRETRTHGEHSCHLRQVLLYVLVPLSGKEPARLLGAREGWTS